MSALHSLVRFLEHAEPPIPTEPRQRREAPLGFTARGAALFVAWLVGEVGEDAVAAKSRDEVLAMAMMYRRSRIAAWDAMRTGNVEGLLRFEALPKAVLLEADIIGLLAPAQAPDEA